MQSLFVQVPCHRACNAVILDFPGQDGLGSHYTDHNFGVVGQYSALLIHL